ncbi:hypothetical protein ATANTOWER_007536 [Ataeniobius toweri]|uniref:Peptidase S1 domain-containing protein n=1 Tax=Ataeniobius toweri TaxID=208326 RepID=A0ABU7BFC8_9TELE|nr:hypothetical protein [Ataeniobius toweri]
MLSACVRPPINSRIIGGQGVSPGSWPWHVTFFSNGGLFCHGSLITDEWVLTGAQCSTRAYLSGAVVHLGANDGSGFSNVTRRIDSIHCHQDFKNNYYDNENDICLLKLSAPVDFTDYIRPVCLASENSTFHEGTASWVTGVESYYYYYYSSNLQDVDMSVIGTNKCSCSYNSSYYSYYNRAITNNMLCARSENGSKTASYADQGAPLVTKQNSIWVQSGIVSYITGYYLGQPIIYTRVSQYQKWISDRITGMEPGFVTFTSPGIDSDLNFTCPPIPSTITTPYTYTFSSPTTTHTTKQPKPTRTTVPHTTDDSIFGSGETLIPITHFSLSVLALFLHLFVGSAGM